MSPSHQAIPAFRLDQALADTLGSGLLGGG